MYINGIDEKDNKIINLLLRDARMSYSDIGKEIGLSRTAVKNRIAVLEQGGIIEGYRAIINPLQSSVMMPFIVNVEAKAEHFNEVKRLFAKASETVTLVQATGACRLVAVCVAEDVETMKSFINRIYKEAEGITYLNANSVLDVVKGSITPK